MKSAAEEEFEKQGAFSRAIHSIRTRYSFATGIFLLCILGMFYAGGRIVLVHFIRDAEQQVQGIGLNITRLVNRDAERMMRSASTAATRCDTARDRGGVEEVKFLLGGESEISLAFLLNEDGSFDNGVADDGKINASDIVPYDNKLREWTDQHKNTKVSSAKSAGIMSIRGRTHYCALAKRRYGGFVIVGTPFDMRAFTGRMGESLSGMDVKVTANVNGKIGSAVSFSRGKVKQEPPKKHSYGIVPMVSEAFNFYSGGFWEYGSNPLEATFTLRDIAGNPISTVSVSLPRTFSSVTSVALGRLTLFVTIAGIVLIIPIFWLQSQILLNPLSEMIERIKSIGEHHDDADCPRIEWKGKDEFAQLAVSVNSMLETISRRSVAIAQSEIRQRALIAGMPDALLVFDRRHRLVSVNKQPEESAKVPGVVEGAGIDISTWGEDTANEFAAKLDKVFEGGVIERLRTIANKDTTNERHFEIRLAKMDDHFALAIFRDVSPEALEHLQNVSAAKRDSHSRKQESLSLLAAGIAHDVNNILALVLSTSEITWMDERDPNVVQAVETIRDAVHRGSTMMRELMTFAGETKILLRPCSPVDIVSEVSRLAKSVVGKNIILDFNIPDNLPAIDADPDQTWKIFFNLVKNAAEAMTGRPGRIEVSAVQTEMNDIMSESFISSNPLKSGKGVLFRISDNGPGIPAETLPRIFDPYVSTKSAGRGLGLAIVYSTVDAHGGGIRVRSVPDRGTTFDVFFPASAELPQVNVANNSELSAGTKVMLIDDDASILKTTSILLKSLKADVYTASNRHDAIVEFRRLAPYLDFVLLDAHLGTFDTVRLLHALRIVSPSVPVVITSGSAPENIKEIFNQQPYNAFLAKPYTLLELKETMTRFTRKRA